MDDKNNTSNYSGRTVDLLLLKTVLRAPTTNHRVGIDVSNVIGEPMIVAGVEKLVQRYAIVFLNALGSTRFRGDHGTSIIPRVSRGFVYNHSTLEAEASEANMLAKIQIIKGDGDDDSPDDERLRNSDVVGLEFVRSKSMAKISIKITTEAGSSYVYVIPVAVGVN